MKKQDLSVQPDPEVKPETASRSSRKVFPDDFKRKAVARMREDGVNASLLAVELGIRRNMLYKWEKALAASAPGVSLRSPGRPPLTDADEMVNLRRKLAKAEQELAILKKFDAYLTRRKK